MYRIKLTVVPHAGELHVCLEIKRYITQIHVSASTFTGGLKKQHDDNKICRGGTPAMRQTFSHFFW